MAMLEINRDPSPKDLKTFGLLLLAFTAILGALIWWRYDSLTWAKWIWSMGGAFAALFFLAPLLRKPIYLGSIYGAFPIGWLISHLLLGMVYYLILTPIGLAMRLVGRDPMHRKFNPAAKTYWLKRPTKTGTDQYFRQF